MARPTEYRDTYPKITERLLSEDKPTCAVCAELNCCKTTFLRWKQEHPELMDAYKRGKAKGQAVFMAKMENAAWNPDTFKSNNSLVCLLAINKYKMTTANTKDKSKVELNTVSLAQALETAHLEEQKRRNLLTYSQS